MSTWYIEHQSEDERHNVRITETLYRGRTRFQTVRVVDTPAYGRILILDGDIQSAQADEATYHEVLVHPAMVTHPRPRRVLIMGGGEGATLREILRHPSVERVVMVDLDGELVEICKEYLPQWSQGVFSDRRLTYLADDARAFVDRTDETFDVIIHDLPQPVLNGDSIAPLVKLFSVECFRAMRARLSPNGVVCLQACSARVRTDDIYRVLINTLQSVFPIVAPMHVYIPSFANDWGFLIGSLERDPRRLEPDELVRRVEGLVAVGRGTRSAEKAGAALQYYSPAIHPTLLTFAPGRPAPAARRAVVKDGKRFPSP